MLRVAIYILSAAAPIHGSHFSSFYYQATDTYDLFSSHDSPRFLTLDTIAPQELILMIYRPDCLCGRISWVQIQRSGFVSTIEELLGRNISGSFLETEITAVGDPLC
jgi:hypothetical protein